MKAVKSLIVLSVFFAQFLPLSAGAAGYCVPMTPEVQNYYYKLQLDLHQASYSYSQSAKEIEGFTQSKALADDFGTATLDIAHYLCIGASNYIVKQKIAKLREIYFSFESLYNSDQKAHTSGFSNVMYDSYTKVAEAFAELDRLAEQLYE